ncbi:MAG: hypothetical protein ABI895_27660 [Deltaproteobacteria bacterium]
MNWLRCIGPGALGLRCILACGAKADAPSPEDRELEEGAVMPGFSGGSAVPASLEPAEQPRAQPTQPRAISAQASAACVALPEMTARQPLLSYEEGCSVDSFEPMPSGMSMAGGGDARELLVGRWWLCGDVAYYGGAQHFGIEFGANGRNQLLWDNGRLRPIAGGPRGVYYLLTSGQYMQRGELSFGSYAGWASFDATGSVLQLADDDEQSGPPLRYVRVAPDERSAATNLFSTSSGSCSMVGVWDTALPSNNPAAAFAFNQRGEWYGGEWGSDLCADHSMYGTYNLETRGGNIQDNFDVPAQTEFELVTNIGAGRCQFWFNAGFTPTFSADCNRVHLDTAWDNCTGGRGYLNSPGDDLIRRVR